MVQTERSPSAASPGEDKRSEGRADDRSRAIAPRATYRLQLHAGFTFADAADAVPYLAELGVSHLYLSPVLAAAPGSTHGYDVVDPDRVNEALGGERGFAALVERARAAGLGILLDIVPNHMSIAGTANRWWVDVLENGAASYYAHYFDVDWSGDERVLLPVLGERYGRALTSGVLAIARGGAMPERRSRDDRDDRGQREALEVRAGELRFPLAPHTIGRIVRRAGDRIAHPELQFIGDALAALPRTGDVAARRRRHRDKAVLLARLGELGDRVAAAIDAEVAAINADPVELDAILEAQSYRLAHWSVAGSQLSYRRFFDIASLVGLCVEAPDVLDASHRRIFSWLRDRSIDGVRIDHVDGLRDPGGYLRRVHEVAAGAGDGSGPRWIVVEKILARGEQLPPSWPVDGTTGYDFMELAGALLVDRDGERALTEAFTAYTGQAFDPEVESRRARLEVMTDALHSELARLTELAVRACATSPPCRDYTRAEIESALAELLAGYPVYRTYLGEAERAPGAGDPPDRARIAHAAAAAARARPDLDGDLLRFLEAALAFELATAEATELARAAQQVSGPVVAKGDEDTLLYRQVRLLARCDVGADLATFAIDPDDAHARLAAGRPRSLLATATHDSKRGEDVRARLAVLSELPDAWAAAAARWRDRAEPGWGDVAPDRTFEYIMWQTLVGAWPLPEDRAQQFAEKATREARLRTSWRRPDAAYEAARRRWLSGVYGDRALIAELEAFAARLRPHGDRNALAQLLIKLTAPGIPDFYQGSELRHDALVDPDNRRPVDLAARARRLSELARDGAAALARLGDDLGVAKLWTIHRVLAARRAAPAAFAAPYRALAASGTHAHRVFAFARGEDLVTVVPRLGVRADDWRGTAIALGPGAWRDALTDREIAGGAHPVAELWRELPIALYLRVAPRPAAVRERAPGSDRER
jgi:(1->4)-alpha-D-glucan 1-alpha-D-glucosylmutase